ncbi:chromosome segregation protein SMC [Streptococcus danieliae]|uniref:Chromosome partition protein Smc n=1 Tax=Streptococcus danieliae TaxID=747656 RepID=A0A7Z0S4N4_9STRE|nr:chromosome segregation protein SMC [Streptococcus danieliae]MBF0699005.1 chromosome segregation protein SMC [Streptococcus danieliae]NYS96182.1 chromosome segregation protein SMC [Streptococcus danieliae]
MYLKEIEIQGFKSFADKTTVTFDEGVTAIVGPNGSGKSNITESLRWALGESSVKSLRGGKMPDVIFAGTESRSPLNYARVRVTLDNQDQYLTGQGEQVQIERQIFRNGDSEYRIDGRKVRLKDIHELFMDTGLGRDSFSIISQGKVEEIFTSKPEERRAIFEEAAGVLKYKTRRKETESKLKQTQENLDRLEDILYELDLQLPPLKEQAEVARRFQTLDSRRSQATLDLILAQLDQGRLELDQVVAALSQVEDRLSSFKERRRALEEDLQTCRTKSQAVEAEMTKKQEDLLALTSLVADYQTKQALLQQESQQSGQVETEGRKRLELLGQGEVELRAALEQLDEELASERQSLSVLQTEEQELRQRLSQSEDPESHLEKLREDYLELLRREADLSNQVTALETQLEAQVLRDSQKSQERQELSQQQKAAREQLDRLSGDLEAVEKELAAALADYQARDQKLLQQRQSYQQHQEAYFSQLETVRKLDARRESLENILANHSNLYAGVRSVLMAQDRLPGIRGVVSEHLSFDLRFQQALDVALGASSQHLIVADEEAATQAIAYLQKQRAGRATFLPLTRIQARTISEQQAATLAQAPGFLGMAVDVIAYDPELAGIYGNLLGTIAIFETIDQARQAARQLNYRLRLITLDGTEIRAGGAYAGGSQRNNQSLLLKPELEQVQVQLQAAQVQLGQQEAALAAIKKEVDADQEELDQLKIKGEAIRHKEQAIRLNWEQAQSDVDRLQTLLDKKTQRAGLEQTPHLQEQVTALKAELQKLGQEKIKLEQDLEALRENKDAHRDQVKELEEQLQLLLVEQTSKKGQLTLLQSQQEAKTAQLTSINQEQEDLKSRLQQLASLEELQGQADTLEKALQETQTQKESNQQSLIRLRFEKEDLEAQVEELNDQLDQARSENEGLIREEAQLDSQCSNLETALRRDLQRLTDDYQLTVEAAREQVQPVQDLDQARAEVKDLEQAIKALGPVNLAALEQYEEVQSRHDFLMGQRQDILDAKSLLMDTMDEMNQEVRERFQTTFEAIRQSFKETFSQMFGGGQADLFLTDPDLLVAGVEISVQPPGKKIQSLNLMSGGEKALSALALLFAIIRVKTIPFVILDEVEAALDEANVKRFGDYLKRFDQRSQFIVVTHRKGTMAAADSMYGVTMQESGVSSLVSVRLKDLEEGS